EARPGPAMAPRPEGLRWYQIPLSSARVPRSVIFSYGFQSGLWRYRQLRVLKQLPVGRPVAPPPPGLLEPCSPSPPPARSPPRASHRSRGTGRARGERGPAQGVGVKGAVPLLLPQGGPWSPPRCPRGPSPRPKAAPRDPHVVPKTLPVPQGSPRSLGTSRCPLGVVVPAEASPFPCSIVQAACPQPDPLANSLDLLAREKREQRQAATPPDDDSSWESPDEDTELPEEHRDFLAHCTMTPRFIPAVHPGEPIFCARSAPVPTLDTRGLKPQSALEGFFFSNSPACQAAFVRDGGLSLLYRCVPTCPLPVLRWLFQLMTLCPDATNASQALWEIWLSTGGEPWCPTAQDVSLAFAHLGADLSPLRRLLPPELCPTDRSLDPSCSPRRASPEASGTLALVTQLGDICKFLALCVVTQPCRYADGARLALVTLLSFLGLDRALRCQPLPELQHLLHCLLEGIRDWQQQVPRAGGEPL
ncbi:F178B protein, partial [Chroicocephalus maculipennis]|nr:F178B protein [Chroicocephalus maculipennis]